MGAAEDGESIPQLLCAHSQDGTTLAAALFQKGSASWLVIGAVEQATSTLRGPAYGSPDRRAPISSRSGSTAAVSSACSTPSTPWIRAAASAPPGSVPGGQPAHLGVAGGGGTSWRRAPGPLRNMRNSGRPICPCCPPSGVELFSRETASSPYGGFSRPVDLSPLRLLLVFPGAGPARRGV